MDYNRNEMKLVSWRVHHVEDDDVTDDRASCLDDNDACRFVATMDDT